jgi:hypothetical protein
VIDGISNPALNSGIGAIPIETKTSGTITEFVYGQDPGSSPVGGVGLGTVAAQDDDLYPGAGNPYNGFSLIASGDFGGARPAFTTYPGAGTGGVTDAAVWNDAGLTVAAAGPETIELGIGNPANGGVRGDSVATDGLLGGDANRDGAVNVTDLGILATNWQSTSGGWGEGNFSGTQNDTDVNVTDLGILATNWQGSATAPAIAAVPEPTTVVLGLLSSVALFCRRRS